MRIAGCSDGALAFGAGAAERVGYRPSRKASGVSGFGYQLRVAGRRHSAVKRVRVVLGPARQR
jgi:hypothetical protein